MDKNRILPVQELSTVIQGEGSLMGIPHLLIRFTGCKLRCQFKDSFCDTWYASWRPEKGTISSKDIIDFIEKNSHILHVFITGGGPTLHKEILPQVVNICKNMGLYVTIETEGSEFVETEADLLSISPKLSNSTPIVGSSKPWGGVVTQKERDNHEKWRQESITSGIKKLINHQKAYGRKYQVKPVISTPEDLEEFKSFQAKLDIPNSVCWLMPEGVAEEQLQKKRQWLFDICIKEGYNYTDRLHVLVYGDKRGV